MLSDLVVVGGCRKRKIGSDGFLGNLHVIFIL